MHWAWRWLRNFQRSTDSTFDSSRALINTRLLAFERPALAV